jgi:SAM-dependent methyltransferase
MDPMLAGWICCPRCGGELADAAGKPGARCQACGHEFGARDGVLDLVDPEQRVSSEGPGDTLAMAWRRRRWDELRGSAAPENAAYLSAIWERLRPDDRVVDLGCGPGTYLGWMAEFAPDLAILGLDLSWPAIEEAGRVARQHPNVRLARASTRRRLPLADASTDVVLRRLAPALPEEAVRVLAPGGYYLRFTFGSGHWREVYERVPGLPRAREDAIAGEAARLTDLGLEVMDPTRIEGSEEVTSAAVMLALRSNPAAFHMEGVELAPLRQLWFDNGRRRPVARLSTEYLVLVARKPGLPAAPATATGDAPAKPRRARKLAEAPAAAEPLEAPAVAEVAAAPKPRRAGKTAAPAPLASSVAADVRPRPAPSDEAATPAPARPRRTRKATTPEPAAPATDPPRRTRKATAAELATEPAAPATEPPKTPRSRRSAGQATSTEPSASLEATAPPARRPRKGAVEAPSGEPAADAKPKRARRSAPPASDA